MFKTLQIRIGSGQIYLTAADDRHREDVAVVPRTTGTTVDLDVDELVQKFESASPAEENGEPAHPRSVSMNADDAIEAIRSGADLNLDGEDRKTVLAAAQQAQAQE